MGASTLTFGSVSQSVAVGYGAGEWAGDAGNVFLGYQAGASEGGSNKLDIDSSNTATPLIYGDFSTDVVRINGTLQILTVPDIASVTATVWDSTTRQIGRDLAEFFPAKSGHLG